MQGFPLVFGFGGKSFSIFENELYFVPLSKAADLVKYREMFTKFAGLHG